MTPRASPPAATRASRTAEWLLRRMAPQRTLADSILGDLREEAARDHATEFWVARQLLGVALALGRVRAADVFRRAFGLAVHLPQPDASPRTTSMTSLAHDFRLAWRLLRTRRPVTLVAAATLALGVGMSTAMFSVVEAVLLRPLPYEQADRLAFLWERDGDARDAAVQSSLRNAAEWRTRTRAFAELAMYRYWLFNLASGPQPEALLGAYVTDNTFATLRSRAAIGRTFRAGEDRPGAPRLAVVSDALWRRRFGADPSVVGRAIRMDGRSYTIIGVMPETFEFPATVPSNAMLPSLDPEIWVPTGLDPLTHSRGEHNWWVIGRLAPGATLAAAASEMQGFAREQHAAHPEASGHIVVRGLRDFVVRPVRPAVLLLFGAVGVVLLIACANVANLLLAQGIARSREMALRVAIGAGRWHITRQLLVESLVLAGAGALAGIPVAAGALALLVRVVPAGLPRVAGASLNLGALGFAVAAVCLTAVVCGLLPAMLAGRVRPAGALRAGGRGHTGGRGLHRVRGALVVAEVALSLVLLAGAGVLARSYRAIAHHELGFRPDDVLTMYMLLPEAKYAGAREQAAFLSRATERVAALPGVDGAAAVNTLPLTGLGSTGSVAVEGRPLPRPEDRLQVNTRAVTPDYFRVMGIPLLGGRGFTRSDTAGAPPVALITPALARRLFPGEDPLGRRLTAFRDGVEIVGLVGDVRDDAVDLPLQPTVYLPTAQDGGVVAGLVVRSHQGLDPRALEGPVRRTLAALDPEQPVLNVRTMADYVAAGGATRRFGLFLTSVFAGAALGLAAVGLYGVLAYLVSQRTRELGVRTALGARRVDVMRLVVGSGLKLTSLGICCGLVGAVLATPLLAAHVYGVSAGDPLTLAAVALLLMAVATGAAAAPAFRAARVSPAESLRSD